MPSPTEPARIAAALLALPVLAVAACNRPPPPEPPPPTERMAVIESVSAPLLNEIEDDDPPAQVGHAGQLVRVVRDVKPYKWAAAMEGKPDKREGMLVELRLAENGTVFYGFRPDLGPEVEVPTVAWFCQAIERDPAFSEMPKFPTCAQTLRRVRLPDGGFAGYTICNAGPCPVAISRQGRLRLAAFRDLSNVEPVRIGERMFLLASSRWSRNEGTWSGGTISVIDLSGQAPRAGREILVDEVDGRDPVKVLGRITVLEVDRKDPLAPAIRLIGNKVETLRADGVVVAKVPIDERYPVLELAPK